MTTRSTALSLLAILALAALLYAPGLDAYFVADDFRYVEVSSQMRSLADVVPYLRGGCTRIGWPVVILAFWVARLVGGVQPSIYHTLSLGIHLANIILVFMLARRMLSARQNVAALLAALIVAFHPRQAESVLWLAALLWPIGTLFSLVMAHCYLSWRETRSLLWLAGAAAAGAMASLSNPGSVVLPLALAAYDIMHRDWRPSSLTVWAGLAIVTTVPALACGVGGIVGSTVSGYGMSLTEGITQVPLYAALVWWPVIVDLKDVFTTSSLAFVAIMIITALAAIVIAVYTLRKGTNLARWGLVWAALGILAPSLFAPVLCDRYMSLMLAGVALLFAGLAESLPLRWHRVAVFAVTLWLCLAVPQVLIRVDDWRAAARITSTVRDETLARYPQVRRGSSFFFIGLPDGRKDALVWSCCVNSAVRVWYNDATLSARRAYNHGAVSTPSSSDVILDFADRGWEQGR